MNNELKRIIKSFNGNVLGIGLDDEISEFINNNKCVKEFNVLGGLSKGKKANREKLKTIKIKKIRKYFKKNDIEFMLCNLESIEKYLNTFVKDSIYLSNFKIYYYGQGDIDDLIKKYKRYDVQIDFNKKYSILEIDTTKAKNKPIKEIFYRVIDFTEKVIDLIGNILMN